MGLRGRVHDGNMWSRSRQWHVRKRFLGRRRGRCGRGRKHKRARKGTGRRVDAKVSPGQCFPPSEQVPRYLESLVACSYHCYGLVKETLSH